MLWTIEMPENNIDIFIEHLMGMLNSKTQPFSAFAAALSSQFLGPIYFMHGEDDDLTKC